MTDLSGEERYANLKAAVDSAEANCTLLPVQRTIGAGYAVQADMVVAVPIPLWDAVLAAASEDAKP